MNSDIAIKVENLSKVYPLRQPRLDEEGNTIHQHYALNKVSFEIKKGEAVGIIGPNGSGKSTLLKILAGVTKPTSGEAKIKGKVASILEIGAGFHPELSGRENIFLNGQILGFSRKEIQESFDDIVTFSGIEKFIEEPVKNYSNGMYLRLAFSIMAHLDFDVYLFDEVLSVGDHEFHIKSKEKIKNIVTEKKTLIFVGHDLTSMSEFCEKYIVIKDSQIQDVGDESVINRYTESFKDFQMKYPKLYFVKSEHYIIDLGNIEINNFSVKSKNVFPQGYDSKSELLIFMKLNVKMSEQLDIGIRLKDSVKGLICSFSTLNSLSPTAIDADGSYSITFKLPANIFASRIYNLDLVVIKNRTSIIHEISDFMSIKMSSEEQSAFAKYEQGNIISPCVEVKIE